MLFTIGYEGVDIASLVLELKDAGIQTLVDVRELPLSRKKGFSKTALSEHLEAVGIEYIHMKSLGAPKPIRHALRDGGNWEKYCEGYSAHLEKCEGELGTLAEMAQAADICLLCFEANFAECHRSLIAAELEKTWKVAPTQHLNPSRQKAKAAAVA